MKYPKKISNGGQYLPPTKITKLCNVETKQRTWYLYYHGASMQADIASGILPYIRCHGLAYGFLVLSKLDVINVQLA